MVTLHGQRNTCGRNKQLQSQDTSLAVFSRKEMPGFMALRKGRASSTASSQKRNASPQARLR
ncbi:hypothetical protein GF367_01140 [Candidatus Woesearchaeota archaeon]|nr:hypothetical protein [Candidatus Woesearchaeota archaeon]